MAKGAFSEETVLPADVCFGTNYSHLPYIVGAIDAPMNRKATDLCQLFIRFILHP